MKGVQCYELFGGIALKITHFIHSFMTCGGPKAFSSAKFFINVVEKNMKAL